MNKELKSVLTYCGAVLLLVVSFVGYSAHENRKAYYECLAVTERISKEHRESNRIVSLPQCRF